MKFHATFPKSFSAYSNHPVSLFLLFVFAIIIIIGAVAVIGPDGFIGVAVIARAPLAIWKECCDCVN